MPVPADPDFEDDVRRRIYEYVERHGSVTPQQVIDEVRVEADRPDSKPPRSGVSTEVQMRPTTFASHLTGLLEAGYLVLEDGELRVAVDSDEETVTLDDGETVTIRLARERDGDAVADVIRAVAGEETYVVAESVAAALDDEPVVRHTNRQTRVIFVATVGEVVERSDDGDEQARSDQGDDQADHGDDRERATETAGDDRSADAPDATGEVVGWVHVEAPELPELKHTAELTVGVREDHRGRGVGGRLLERGLAWADERGYRKVYQSVPATNESAVGFLEDHGWEVEGVRKEHYLVGDDLVDEVMLATWVDR